MTYLLYLAKCTDAQLSRFYFMVGRLRTKCRYVLLCPLDVNQVGFVVTITIDTDRQTSYRLTKTSYRLTKTSFRHFQSDSAYIQQTKPFPAVTSINKL